MLIAFRFSNFRSFRDLTELSMLASSDKEKPENVYHHEATGLRILRSACVYGANASGKSNLLGALGFMHSFVCFSHNWLAGDFINLNQFALDTVHTVKPSIFEIEFLQNDIRYLYGFSATSQKIEEEWLDSYPVGRRRMLFKRDEQSFQWGDSWKGRKGRLDELAEMTRDNALFLSVASQWNDPEAQLLYHWFSERIFNVKSSNTLDYRELSTKFFDRASEYQSFSESLLRNADLGIRGAIKKDGQVYLLHRGIDSEGLDCTLPLHIDNESDGTQKLFWLSAPLFLALKKQSLLLADELPVFLHEHLTRLILRLFSGEIDDNRAQLLMSTHGTTFLEHFRRDQIWFVEKGEDGASEVYSLWDFQKVRKGENVQKGYLAGRYGAVPYTDDLNALLVKWAKESANAEGSSGTSLEAE